MRGFEEASLNMVVRLIVNRLIVNRLIVNRLIVNRLIVAYTIPYDAKNFVPAFQCLLPWEGGGKNLILILNFVPAFQCLLPWEGGRQEPDTYLVVVLFTIL